MRPTTDDRLPWFSQMFSKFFEEALRHVACWELMARGKPGDGADVWSLINLAFVGEVREIHGNVSRWLYLFGQVEGEAPGGVRGEAGGGVGFAGAVIVFEDFEGNFSCADGAGFVFDRADECLADAAALMGWENVEIVDVDDWFGGEG